MRNEEETSEPRGEATAEERPAKTGELVLAAEILPDGLPIIPVRPRPAFPGILIPMAISGRERVAASGARAGNPVPGAWTGSGP